MLTNLLAIFIVILLSSPKVAYASDTVGLSKTPTSTGEQVSKEPTDGRFRESDENVGKVKTDNVNELSSDGGARRAAAGDRAPFSSSQEDGSRVLTARLKGSLCVSCLYQLEKKIQELGGVKSARVIRPPKNVASEDNDRAYAQVQIIYLPSKLNPKKIRQFVQRNDFGIRDEKDVAMTSDFKPLPDPFENERSSGVVNAQFK